MKRLPQDPDEGDVVNRQFLLGRYHAHPARRGTRPRRFDVYYAPLHGFQDQAKVVLIGVTPGIQQMLVAFREARRLLHQGAAAPGIYHLIRRRMAFAGQTRVNLIRLLEAVQLPQMLGLSGAGELFGRASSLLHSTSALRYPVLVNGANYTGHNPPIRRLPSEIRSYLPMLSDQLNGLPDALVVPLGPAVEEALRLIDFNERRVLTGFPHPSGANRGRHATFVRQRAPELRRVLGAASL
ncbi:MAG: hypothetical protein F4Y86_19550 [Gammaproteobacteria bacterium]|nr:hypothetical protein [Gammaproteobacteria bacterium]MYB36069.1 hypothetical protein [Gammaproteobacteria bacterium]